MYSACFQLLDDLPKTFRAVMKKYNLAAGDFPEMEDYRQKMVKILLSNLLCET
jgi:hypothetical protein